MGDNVKLPGKLLNAFIKSYEMYYLIDTFLLGRIVEEDALVGVLRKMPWLEC